MKSVVCIETTIPSFYHSIRNEPDMIALRDWTRSWWHQEREDYDTVTSDAVIEELQNGDHILKQEKISLLAGIPLLEISSAVAEIVQVYINHKLMPQDATGDALHLALASFHKCDYLLAWNCKHIANANKVNHIRRINQMLQIHVPELVTPLELVQENP